MWKGCNIIVWLLVLTPLALAASLFFVSTKLGLLALGIIVVTLGLYLASGFLLTRVRERCPGCDAKSLKCINWFRANPPPNFAFYKCEDCGTEYVKVDGDPEIVKRENSPYKDVSGWDGT